MRARVEVAKFSTIEEARVVVGLLQSHGIDAELADAHVHAVLPMLPFGKYRILAPAEQARAAQLILQSARA